MESNILDLIFGKKKTILNKGEAPRDVTVIPSVVDQAKAVPELLKLLGGNKYEQDLSVKQQKKTGPGYDSPMLQPIPAQMGQVLASETKSEPQPANLDKITKAINVYGGKSAPLHKYANQIAQATEKYDFFKQNPYLLPLIAHLETSSGRNITRPNNLTNWGINYPGNNEAFSQMSVEEVFDKMISGLGERSGIYKKFRTGKPLTDEELIEFAKIYEPANPDYGPNLVNGIKFIESQLNVK